MRKTNLEFNYGMFSFTVAIEGMANENKNAIKFVNVHKTDMGRIGSKYHCLKCGQATLPEDLIKGNVVGKEIVPFTPDELKTFETKQGILTLGLTKDINPDPARIKKVYSIDVSVEKKTMANNKVRYAVIQNGLKKNNVAIKAIVKFNSRGIKSNGEFGIIRYNPITNKMEFLALYYKEEMLPISKMPDFEYDIIQLDKATDNLFGKELTMLTSIDDVEETHTNRILKAVEERIKMPEQTGLLKKEAKSEEERLLMNLAGI